MVRAMGYREVVGSSAVQRPSGVWKEGGETASRAETVSRSRAILGEVVGKLEAAEGDAAALAALLEAVQSGTAAPSIVVLLAQPDESLRQLAIKVGSALCRDLLPAFARSDAARVIKAEQRLALARVLRAWLPLPGSCRTPVRPGNTLMQALRTQMKAEWSTLRNLRKTRSRAILPGREPRLHLWYSSTGESGVSDPCDFYRRRAYDTPRGSTAEELFAVWGLVGSQHTALCSMDSAIAEKQQDAVLRAGSKEPRWRTRWDGRAALVGAGAIENLVRLVPMAADAQQLDLKLGTTPEQDAERPTGDQAEEEGDSMTDTSGITLEGQEGRWRAVREGETFSPGHRCVLHTLRAFCVSVPF